MLGKLGEVSDAAVSKQRNKKAQKLKTPVKRQAALPKGSFRAPPSPKSEAKSSRQQNHLVKEVVPPQCGFSIFPEENKRCGNGLKPSSSPPGGGGGGGRGGGGGGGGGGPTGDPLGGGGGPNGGPLGGGGEGPNGGPLGGGGGPNGGPLGGGGGGPNGGPLGGGGGPNGGPLGGGGGPINKPCRNTTPPPRAFTCTPTKTNLLAKTPHLLTPRQLTPHLLTRPPGVSMGHFLARLSIAKASAKVSQKPKDFHNFYNCLPQFCNLDPGQLPRAYPQHNRTLSRTRLHLAQTPGRGLSKLPSLPELGLRKHNLLKKKDLPSPQLP
ncbi:hypothetical protein K435DRAFT_872712 [Dendrothele bispora CBS 962.96]|uniref:Uncharacterized protein n=1 Tax=Dendrothele bispora (strain CBS 962.96) TaxID=1314807 RepID=A0A4S8L0X0_DENBC|nr:hypothetical protein K435DRAFT_872712 [Dendrothele bispora CBS 962.96]